MFLKGEDDRLIRIKNLFRFGNPNKNLELKKKIILVVIILVILHLCAELGLGIFFQDSWGGD